MVENLKELFESQVLSDDTKKALSEAWSEKEKAIKESVRNEFKARYEEDRKSFTVAMNTMLNEAVEKHATESALEMKKLRAERSKLAETAKTIRSEQHQKVAALEKFVQESLSKEFNELAEEKTRYQELRKTVKENYKKQFDDHIVILQKFMGECLQEEIQKMEAKAGELESQRIEALRKIKEHRLSVNKKLAEHMEKIENFVFERLNEEMREFEQDKNKLAETRANLILKHRQDLAEAKKSFVEKSTRLVESTVNQKLRKVMSEMKEDIREAKKNEFARKIFESFKDEYTTAHLEDNRELRSLKQELSTMMEELQRTKDELNESRNQERREAQRVRMVEERSVRERIMNDLLRPLSTEKRKVMESLLSSTKTSQLKESFRSYLPTLYGENVNSVNGRTALIESNSRTVTGNRNSRLTESASKTYQDDEISKLRHLAGLKD